MKLFKVKGNSMYPVLRDSDLVVVRETAPELLRTGNILVYHLEDKEEYLIHRLVKKGEGDVLYLRGDGYNLSLELTRTGAIMGKAIGFVRNSRYEPLNRPKELRSWSVSLLKEYAKYFLRWVSRKVIQIAANAEIPAVKSKIASNRRSLEKGVPGEFMTTEPEFYGGERK